MLYNRILSVVYNDYIYDVFEDALTDMLYYEKMLNYEIIAIRYPKQEEIEKYNFCIENDIQSYAASECALCRIIYDEAQKMRY